MKPTSLEQHRFTGNICQHCPWKVTSIQKFWDDQITVVDLLMGTPIYDVIFVKGYTFYHSWNASQDTHGPHSLPEQQLNPTINKHEQNFYQTSTLFQLFF